MKNWNWLKWLEPGKKCCAVCGSKDVELARSRFLVFGELWCGPCLIVGGGVSIDSVPLKVIGKFEHQGKLDDSRHVFRNRHRKIYY